MVDRFTQQALLNPEPEEGNLLLDFGADVALAVPRGLLGAAEGTVNLFGLLAPGDFRVDFDILGRPKTIAGNLLTGVSQFAAGFGAAGRVFQALNLGSGAIALAGQGALADFLVFDGDSGRLADLLAQFPQLKPLIPEILQSQEDDSELIGRLKNTLEGLGIGGLTSALVASVRTLGRKARALQAERPVVSKPVPPEKLGEDLSGIPEPDPDVISRAIRDNDEEIRTKVSEILPEEIVREKPKFEEAFGQFSAERKAVEQQTILDIDLLVDRAKGLVESGVDPARAVEEELTRALNLKAFDDAEVVTMNRLVEPALEKVLDKLGVSGSLVTKSFAQQSKDAFQNLGNWVNSPAGAEGDLAAMLYRDLESARLSVRKAQSRLLAARITLGVSGRRLFKLAQKFVDGSATMTDRVLFIDYLTQHQLIMGQVKGVSSEFGRGLGLLRRKITTLDETKAEDILFAGFKDPKKVDELAKKIATLEGAADPLGALAKAAENPDITKLDIITSIYRAALLTGPRTHVVNTASGAFLGAFIPAERYVGAKVAQFLKVKGAGTEATRNKLLLKDFAGSPAAALARRLNPSLEKKLAEHAILPDTFSSVWGLVRRNFQTRGLVGQVDPTRAKFSRDVSPLTLEGINAAFQTNLVPDSVVGMAAKRLLSSLDTASFRLLGAEDAAISGLVAHSSAKADFTVLGRQLGLVGEDLARFVQGGTDVVFSKAGTVFDDDTIRIAAANLSDSLGKEASQALSREAPRVAQRALRNSAAATLSEVGGRGTIQRQATFAAQNIPVLNFFAPFINIPFNVVKFAAGRVPGALVTGYTRALKHAFQSPNLEEFRKNLVSAIANSADPETQVEFLGRLATAHVVTAATFAAAQAGIVTGRGPADKRLRDLMLRNGWQPYSIRVGDTYVSFARFDPFSTMLAIVADAYEGVSYALDDDQPLIQALSTGIITAFTANITQKTFLAGLDQLFGILEGDKQSISSFTTNFLPSFIPNVFRQVSEVTDPYFRESRNMLDEFLDRIPGLSNRLEPARDILGEPIHRRTALFSGVTGGLANAFVPVAVSSVSDDEIFNELQENNIALSRPRAIINGIDLRDISVGERSAFDKYQELVGKVRIRGRTIRQELKALFKSSEYRRATPISISGVEGARDTLIKQVFSLYRREALRRLRKDNPSVDREFRAVEVAKRRSRFGL